MSGIAFDTLRLAERLEAVGMPPQQARGLAAALADTIGGTFVTREHFETCRTADREYLDLRLGETEARLRGEIAGLRGETHEGEARLRGEIAGLRAELIKWAVGIGVASVLAIGGMILSATLALMRLMH
jgi:hypothetical protein